MTTSSPETAFAGDASDALEWCRRYTRRHGENFTVVSWFLPRELRAPMFAVYAFCRFTDNIGDDPDAAPDERLVRLDKWQVDLERGFDGSRPQHPINLALQHVAADKPLRVDPFCRLIEANRLDQRTNRYETFQDVLAYCDLSANPVGEMVLQLWNVDTETDEGRYRVELSDATCTALQIANHWQDVRRDYLDEDRLYLPLEELRGFGLSEDDIANGIRDRRCPESFREMMRFQVDRAEAYFRKGERLIDEVPAELAIDLRLFTDGGRAVLKAIERRSYDTLARRPRVGKLTRAWLAARAAVQLKLA
ncbi:MAG: squalene synthase HpnC [Chloroflexi bacterium]|nr:squalene synthase HpnC [Chloroflexota bacterium]MCY3696464.1 squalene synthase HpnC [Chloroflexota bacterium]